MKKVIINKAIHIGCFLLIVIGYTQPVFGKCVGRFVNPITDICWSCIFPITIGGMKVSAGGEDTPNPKQLICTCTKPFPRIGRQQISLVGQQTKVCFHSSDKVIKERTTKATQFALQQIYMCTYLYMRKSIYVTIL